MWPPTGKTGKSLTMPDPDSTKDARRCRIAIAHAAFLVPACSMRTCIVVQQNNIPRESLPLRQDNLRSHRPAENNTSHLTVCGILNRHSHGHSYLCIYHVTNPTYNCMRQFSTSHWTPENIDQLQQNRCADCMRKRSSLSEWPSYINNVKNVFHINILCSICCYIIYYYYYYYYY